MSDLEKSLKAMRDSRARLDSAAAAYLDAVKYSIEASSPGEPKGFYVTAPGGFVDNPRKPFKTREEAERRVKELSKRR